MKFLIINGKIQTLGGKPIVVPDDYDNDTIKIGGKLVKTGTGLIGSKHSGGSGGESTVAAGAIFNDDAYRNMDGIDGDVFLTWEELKDPTNGELYMYDVSTITDTEIGPYVFASNVNLKSIIIPNDINSIGEFAFGSCENLTSIKIPDNVTFIGPYAFSGCINLKSITIPNSVTFIDGIFDACDYLEDINFNGTLEQLNAMESFWFGRCGVATDYGSSIIHCIDKCLDSNTYNEINCPIHGTGPVITSLAIKTMPNKTAYLSGEYFDKTGLVLTATWSDGSTTEVTDNEITVVIGSISSSTTEIMVRCLHKICYVPITVRVITSLAIKTMPNKTAYCDGEIFDKTGLVLTATWQDGSTTEVTDNEITVVDRTISSSRSYNRVKYGDKTCNIYIELLNSFELSSANYTQAGITREGDVIIPETFEYNDKKYKVTSIGYAAFRDCTGLTNITIPNSVTSIGKYAFEKCTGLTNITIPNSVTSIGDFAFEETNITNITIPNSVTSIGYNPFARCTKLESITVGEGNTKYNSKNNCNAIIKTATNTLISGCKNTVIPYGVDSIGLQAFDQCTGLTSITIPNGVKSIGETVFQMCTGLTSITIPNSVTSIGKYAFNICSHLTSITFNGTQEQWNAITKGTGWNKNTGNYTIHCTDGDIPKS